MIQYVIRRLLASIPVLFGILLITFAMGRMVPGDPCKAILGERASAATCAQFVKTRGLDQPIPVQFGIYLRDVARGDLGNSIKFSRPVTDILIERMPLTVELSLSAMFLAVLVGIPLGIVAATRRNSLADVVTMMFANIGVSIPVFFLGLMLAYFFALVLRDTPFQLPPSGRLPAGMTPTPFYQVYEWEIADAGIWRSVARFFANMYIFNALITGDWEVLRAAIRHMILPAVALSTIPMAIIARMTRSSMLEVLGLDYIRTARAKGLPYIMVVFKHALRNALLPVVTIIGLQLGAALGGAILTETIFGLTGIGRTLFEAITGRDYPIVQAVTLVIAVVFVFANLIVDLSYAYLDPRIKLD
ncbi:MAG: ABC transporter permease [Chloroflexota bacterium]|nr:ABC transporter permease [Chloroflexota bacterium]